MKIWITRLSTGELHAGGLGRCQVWFTKPKYMYACTDPHYIMDLPFENEVTRGLGRWGWMVDSGHDAIATPVSFGKLFGYKGDFAYWVWDKLTEHYGNTEFPSGWYKHEESGECRQEDFILEVDLEVIPKLSVC